ncbi:MAG: hypothetical protein CVV24_05740 [Ignavibacteriae bacterium HGW-Ignavibacteriae-3]|nr:MAG: hypothetical protein CVV24_05740 [Ignavibacteriae bacterium HGW-Ignavibacteriae-3]
MRLKKFSLILISALLLCFVLFNQTFGQVSNIVSAVRIGDAKEKMPLSISAELFAGENISGINVVYRPFGETEFKKMEMMIAGNTASVILPAAVVQPPYLEYYLSISLRNGSMQTYPSDIDKGVSPLQVAVSALSSKDREIIILSPNDGETSSLSETLISISFIRAPDKIDIPKTKIYLNDQDVSALELIAGDLIMISGDNLAGKVPLGAKSLKIEVYDKSGNLYHTLTRSFQMVSEEVALAVASRFKMNGNINGETRNENFNSAGTMYSNISADFNGSYDQWTFNGYAYLTSEEKNNLQPYNRFSASVQAGDWLQLKVGDSYPRFPNLIMDGKRVRGFSGTLNFGVFNFQTAYGEVTRDVEGTIIQKYSAGNVPLGSNIIKINDINTPYASVDLGTFSRQIFSARPSFGRGENFQFGLSYLHSKDDPGSIKYGAKPQENITVGTDLMFALDDQNILFTSQAAISVLNKDISGGSLTDAQIDSVFGPNGYFDVDPADVKQIRDIIGKFITVNQNLGPWNPQEFSSLAAEAALSLNYFGNNLHASYIYRGNDYQSFGQSFLRTDVKGINFVDRIRLADNKLFISFGYENLQDNLQKTKPTTTTFQTLSTSVSYFPRMNFPNVTVGFNRYENSNGLSLADSSRNRNALNTINDVTSRFLIQLSYDFNYHVKHSASLSFTTSDRSDESIANLDSKFNSGSFTLNSFWNQQLTSLIGLVYSSSSIAAIPFDYVTLTAGARYKLLHNKLLLSATLSPSFGDFKRQVFEFTADYNLLSNFNLVFQARIYRIPDASTNSIVGLSARLSI